MREYLLRRYYERKKEAQLLLGGKCRKCGSINKLEFDHIDPKEKEFTISMLWNISHDRFIKEVKKCQLLCKECHKKKTLEDLGQQDARKTHGTLSSYRYCRCSLCLKAKRDWNRQYKRVHSKSVMHPPFKRDMEGPTPSGPTGAGMGNN